MKLLIAIAVAAFCSAAVAAPVRWLPLVAPVPPQPVFAPRSDLRFNLLPSEDVFAEDDAAPLVTTTLDSDTAVPQDFRADSSGPAAQFRVPEPSPLITTSLGLIFFGILLLLRRRLRIEKRRSRRRTLVKMRAIIAER